METLEGAVADLSAVPPPWRHNVMDITLGHLRRIGEVRAYGDRCAKVAWTTAFATLQKAECSTSTPLLPAPCWW